MISCGNNSSPDPLHVADHADSLLIKLDITLCLVFRDERLRETDLTEPHN